MSMLKTTLLFGFLTTIHLAAAPIEKGQSDATVSICTREKVNSVAVDTFHDVLKLYQRFDLQTFSKLAKQRDQMLESTAPECKILGLTIQDLLNTVLLNHFSRYDNGPMDKGSVKISKTAVEATRFDWKELRTFLLSLDSDVSKKINPDLKRNAFDESGLDHKIVQQQFTDKEFQEHWLPASQSAENPFLLNAAIVADKEARINYAYARAIVVAQSTIERDFIFRAFTESGKSWAQVEKELESVVPKGRMNLKGNHHKASMILLRAEDNIVDSETFRIRLVAQLRPFLRSDSLPEERQRILKRLEFGFLLPQQ